MRILQINSVCGVGSTGRIATDIDKILKNKGHESFISYGRGKAINCNTAIRIGNNKDNYYHVANTRLLDRHGFASSKATRDFINKAEELNPDVIHLHNIHGYYINIELLFNYLKKANKPVVWTLHDCWTFTGHCSHFDYIGCDKWKSECHSCPQVNEYPKSFFIDNSKSNFMKKKELFTGIKNMTIVTPSNWLAKMVRQSFLKDYNLKVINNGIDLDLFHPDDSLSFRRKYYLEDKFLILGVASIWNNRKGLRNFLELSKLIDNDTKIVLVGLNDKQLKGLPNNIIGIRRTNNIEELVEIYSTANVFVNPTLEEVMGLTNVESLACGTPVITFNTGGSVECLGNNCGFIVEKESVKEVLERIDIIKKRGKLSFLKQCVDHAHKNYNKEDKFTEYVQLYEEVLRY